MSKSFAAFEGVDHKLIPKKMPVLEEIDLEKNVHESTRGAMTMCISNGKCLPG